MKNPDRDRKPSARGSWAARWISIFADFPPECGPNYRHGDAATIDSFTGPVPAAEYKIPRSRMMRILGGMATKAQEAQGNSPQLKREVEVYTAGLIGALHAIESENGTSKNADDVAAQGASVSYSELRAHIDATQQIEAVSESEASHRNLAASLATAWYEELYAENLRP